MLHSVFDLQKGLVPDDIADLTVLGKSLSATITLGSQSMAVIIAAAKQSFGAARIADWIAWCSTELGVKKICYRSHLAAIGEMLISYRESADYSIDHYSKVFRLDLDKLLSLSRLPLDVVPGFLSRFRDQLATMSRDEVRAAVAEALGEPVRDKARAEQLQLPGFETALDTLVGIGEAVAQKVDSPEVAQKALLSGMGLLGASLRFTVSRPDADADTLRAVKQALLDEVAAIDLKLTTNA